MNTTTIGTPPGAAADHLTPQMIAAYFADTLTEDALLTVEAHVAQCDACALASQHALANGEVTTDRLADLSDLVDGWTAAGHGQAALRSLMVRGLALARARATVATLRDRLVIWEQQWSGQAEAAVRVLLDAPGQAARILTDGLQELARPNTRWQFAPVPAAIPTRGVARRRGAQQPVAVTAASPGGPTARVAVSGERGEVVIRVDYVAAGSQPPLVLLLPTDTAVEPQVALPEPSPGGDGWIARFSRLGPGDYVVAFEPLGA